MSDPAAQPPGGGPPGAPLAGAGQQPPYPQYGVPSQAGMPPAARKPDETLALISLVLSVGSFIFGLMFLLSVPGVVLGHMARRRIREDPLSHGGDSMAAAGLVVGYINIGISALAVVAILLAFGVPFCMACVAMGAAAAGGG